MSKTITILGSTGSIGTQTLDVIAHQGYKVAALTAQYDVETMESQCRKFNPEFAVMVDEDAATDLKIRLSDTNIKVGHGAEGLIEAAAWPSADVVVVSVVGISGLKPTLAAIDAGKQIALANKETLVCAGELVMQRAEEKGVDILPVDSEHSAIFQCLQGCTNTSQVKRLILTASGGPFYGYSKEQLDNVTLEQTLAHPNWAMGAKVTVDSATLMNKGLELIEAMRLYRVEPEKISILVHRESIVHSMVEYCDNAVLAQMGAPDMRVPIQYALTWPARTDTVAMPWDFMNCSQLTFGQPDREVFPCLALAEHAAKIGGTATAILNGANEVAVAGFLNGTVRFSQIPQLVAQGLERVRVVQAPTIEDIWMTDLEVRNIVKSLI